MYPFIKLEHPERFNLEAAVPLHRHLWLHPEKHQQRTYGHRSTLCGTVGCVAGWACMLDPDTQVTVTRYDMQIDGLPPFSPAGSSIEVRARKILGLTSNESCKMFLDVMPAFVARLRLGSMIRQARRYHKAQARAEEERQRALDLEARALAHDAAERAQIRKEQEVRRYVRELVDKH